MIKKYNLIIKTKIINVFMLLIILLFSTVAVTSYDQTVIYEGDGYKLVEREYHFNQMFNMNFKEYLYYNTRKESFSLNDPDGLITFIPKIVIFIIFLSLFFFTKEMQKEIQCFAYKTDRNYRTTLTFELLLAVTTLFTLMWLFPPTILINESLILLPFMLLYIIIPILMVMIFTNMKFIHKYITIESISLGDLVKKFGKLRRLAASKVRIQR